MKFSKRSEGLLKKFWILFVFVLLANQILLLAGLYFFLLRPAVESFSMLSVALVDAKYRQVYGGPLVHGILSEKSNAPNYVTHHEGIVPNLEGLPPYPGLKLIGKRLEEELGESFHIGFISNPEETLYIQHHGEKPFALGISLKDRLLGLQFLFVALSLILIISSLAAWRISGKLTKPLTDLSKKVRGLSRSQEPIDLIFGNDCPQEIVALAAHIQESHREIGNMLAERERFLAGIAHDLRTPLCRMRVALELGAINDKELGRGLQEDIEEMRAILDQFLELSRLDAEGSEIPELGDLNETLEQIAKKYQRAGESLVLELSANLPSIWCRKIALTRMIYNLVDNAIKHGVGAVVLATGVIQDSRVRLRISNLSTLDAKSSALNHALLWVGEGQMGGLGLAITRRLAEIHGADLKIVTLSPGILAVEITFQAICNTL